MDRRTLVKDWLAALRSGNYKQITGFLHTEDGFCPFGVLCDVVDSEAWIEKSPKPKIDKKVFEWIGQHDEMSSTWQLSPELYDMVGMTPSIEFEIIKRNDKLGQPFKVLADYIQEVLGEEED